MTSAPFFELLPESREALAALQPSPDREDPVWLDATLRLAEVVRQLVPDLVGVSLGREQAGLTFTVVASEQDIAVLDAVQSATGECTARVARALEPADAETDDVLDEQRWRRLAQVTAARTIRSTLTLPILGLDGSVRWSVSLYAASSRAFDDVRSEVAEVFGAYADGAVTNADLSFHSRTDARRAPEVLRERATVELAIDILVVQLDIDAATARRYLEAAAAQDGTTVRGTASRIVALHLPPGSDGPGTT